MLQKIYTKAMNKTMVQRSISWPGFHLWDVWLASLPQIVVQTPVLDTPLLLGRQLLLARWRELNLHIEVTGRVVD